ncbi:FecR family protein [Mucilaginibacter sp. RS28]|uniref:FecR family protein n=1 Tax=Mucilaginibacter straminoryzae TaxID=2932774 RepID=A0A9X1X6N1_9SPHI|nr:FecR family protein [Mucilaginibacter straminoryzae]MCJ8212004.1 FecR family protein [Mucilaginibacter straminoryzae]
MKKTIPDELLERYLNGQCSEEELARVREWYHSFSKGNDQLSEMSQTEVELLEKRLYGNITEAIGQTSATSRGRVVKMFRYAAAVAVAALFVGGFYFLNTGRVSFKTAVPVAQKTVEQVDITNNSNTVYKAHLPDKSIVWLQPGSNLRYPKTFAANARVVSMYGVGFFEVTKNPKRPFIINGRSIITKVWGTSFLIRDKYRSKTADVSVVTGKVSVSLKKNEADDTFSTSLEKHEVLLYPKDKAICFLDQHLLKTERVVREPALKQWSQASLSFDNKPMREIIPVLSATYGVKIKVANERINRYMLTADFEGFNLPDILAALKKSINVSYEIKDDLIELN